MQVRSLTVELYRLIQIDQCTFEIVLGNLDPCCNPSRDQGIPTGIADVELDRFVEVGRRALVLLSVN